MAQATMFHCAGLSDLGRVREENQDAFYMSPERGVFMVVDGMGGVRGGEIAAGLIVEHLPGILERRLRQARRPSLADVREVMLAAIADVNAKLCEATRGRDDIKGMGATLVLALIRGWHVHVAHIGDSRAYLLRAGKLAQLTDDHSVVSLLMKHGLLTAAEARKHPARSHILKHVGMETGALPEVKTLDLKKGDRFLLCTDGLNGMIEDDEILAVLDAAPSPQAACRKLVDAANDAGGHDNTTVVVINYH